ncbi:dnaJ homolog subfamily C member 12 isoform X1 [Ictalurus furcatus]|uniref:dnaJ homolog subfamily C member 12 isoform X1 n=1 Tax=Ictalurus furcatus TaxID=66913 RepID=UPI002350B1C1|nr:dnaJ homolog subfamily C member 12 isoform X1 [Ictalurus furcatus]
MEKIINCKMEDLEDYYGLLGCDEFSTTEQIRAEYKVRALSCHPDKHPENHEAAQEFQKLQQAKDILTDETKRRKYDYWLRSSITVPFSEWQSLSDTVKISMHWALKSKKEPMLTAKKDMPEFQAGQSETQVPIEGISSDEELSSSDYWHHRFRCTSDTPSILLKKFRNYQI